MPTESGKKAKKKNWNISKALMVCDPKNFDSILLHVANELHFFCLFLVIPMAPRIRLNCCWLKIVTAKAPDHKLSAQFTSCIYRTLRNMQCIHQTIRKSVDDTNYIWIQNCETRYKTTEATLIIGSKMYSWSYIFIEAYAGFVILWSTVDNILALCILSFLLRFFSKHI